MLNQKTFTPLPAFCMVALLVTLVVGLAFMPDAAEAAGLSKIQGVDIVPGMNSGCSCGPNCQPYARYWGHWPTVWRQWPQKRPDIYFPEAIGKERLPAPEGVKPEPLPKEEPQYSPGAPQSGGGFLPPVGDGPATGPGGPGAPFQLEPSFDPGSGFDQGVPGMENLPAQPALPGAMPNEGTGAPPAVAPPAATPAEIPPATNTPPAPSVPAPNKGSADPIPASSVLTLQPLPSVEAREPIAEEIPALKETVPNDPQPEKSRLPETEPSTPQPSEPQEPGPQLVKTLQAKEEALPAEEIASAAEMAGPLTEVTEPAAKTAELSGNSMVVSEPLAETKQPAPEPVRQTAFESPAEPWAIPKSWKSQRAHTDNGSPEKVDVEMAELHQPRQWQPAPEPGDMEVAEAPQPAVLHDDRGKVKLVGLEGYCPVDLVRGEKWTQGESRFAVEFEGYTYLMSGPQQHRAFRSNPGRYAPANAGNDPVLSFEENVLKAGHTESCAVFEGRLYMFENIDTLARFQANPKRYTRALRKAKDN